MTTFGDTLRTFREASNDPIRGRRRLSQNRLGELIGWEMQDRGVTGAAVSDWERGESTISVEDRGVLIAIIKVLYRGGGIRTLGDANQLLESGDYRALNGRETQEIFGKTLDEQTAEPSNTEHKLTKSLLLSLVEYLFGFSETELRESLAKAEKGPTPSWPRVLAAFMRKASERISFSSKTILWIGIWWLAWWFMGPSLYWPFADRRAALQAIGMYVIGSLVVPLLMGMLVDTKHNQYWHAQGLANSRLLRLYTYQGAGIGFNLGYFFALPVVLIRHYLGLGSSHWPVFIAVTLGVVLGNTAARVIPHNLWLAYGRLQLRDGAIFFVVAFIGPLWGIFFLEFYSVLLQPFWGVIVILAAFLLFVMIPIGQTKRKTGTEQTSP